MAANDNAVFIPGTGYMYVAPVSEPRPVDQTAPAGNWVDLGHTSRDNGLGIGREGGDSEVLGSWQNPNLRERRDPISYYVTINLLQFDNANLALFFGGGDTTEAGVFGVPLNPTAQEHALFVRIVDGANDIGLYVPKVSIAPEDDMEVDVESFLEMPVRATILGVTGSNLMEFLNDNLGLESP
jgi:hypothetical protein